MSDKDKLKKNRTLLVASASWHLGRRVDRSAARESGEIAWVTATRNAPDQSTFSTPGERGCTDYPYLGQSAVE